MARPAVLKRWIALELKRLRKQAGLKQKDAAARLDRSQQHIGYLESARNLPSAGDLKLLLGLYGMQERIEFMRELLSAAKKGKNWWTPEQRGSQIVRPVPGAGSRRRRAVLV